MKIKAFVFAAGLGTRLRPLTNDRPKALVNYDGIPLLKRVLDKVIASDIHDIVINVHHFPDQIIEYVRQNDFNANIRFSDERAYLRDTAGGLKFAEPFLDDADTILLYNVDILSDISLEDFISFHQKHGADVTLAVRDRKTSRYLMFDTADMSLCGWKNKTTGEQIVSKKTADSVDLAFSGIHLVNRDFIRQIPTVEKLSITPLYVRLANNFRILGYQHEQSEWMDVGKLEEFRNVLS